MRTLHTILLSALASVSTAQGYIPFPESNATWLEYHGWLFSDGIGDTYTNCTREITFSNDTVIAGTGYHQLFSTGACVEQMIFPPLTQWNYTEPLALYMIFRQDIPARQVFLFNHHDGLEYLLYDFSIGTGTYPATFNNVIFPSLEVVRIDSVPLADGWHQRWTTGEQALGSDSVRVLEGIGSTFGLLGAMIGPFESGSTLGCFTHNDSVVWSNPFVPGDPICSLAMAIPAHASPTTEIAVVPNPFHEAFDVQLPRGTGTARYRLFTMLGVLVAQGSINGPVAVPSGTRAGCYVLEVTDAAGSFLGRERVIKR
ncbi:MAG: T9SS type A sorting domain-containing protein [Flavobacteriales bacterium]|nr:T9SS type A sorting domain-containing protein [Flavobacteriales bacterium]